MILLAFLELASMQLVLSLLVKLAQPPTLTMPEANLVLFHLEIALQLVVVLLLQLVLATKISTSVLMHHTALVLLLLKTELVQQEEDLVPHVELTPYLYQSNAILTWFALLENVLLHSLLQAEDLALTLLIAKLVSYVLVDLALNQTMVKLVL